MVILDENHEVFDVVEFENVYDLGALLCAAREIGAHLESYDLDKAKQALFHEFSMERASWRYSGSEEKCFWGEVR